MPPLSTAWTELGSDEILEDPGPESALTQQDQGADAAALIARACIRTPDRRRRTPAHTCAHAPSLRPPPAPARTCTWHRQHVCMTTAITIARTNCPPPRCVLGEQTMACRRNQGGVAGVSSWRGTAILCTSLKQSEWTWRCCRSSDLVLGGYPPSFFALLGGYPL